jgi:uncharacterized OB-fold protein
MGEKKFARVSSLVTMACAWSVGPFMDKFYTELSQKRFVGTRCPKCRTTYVPPRSLCGGCWKPLTDAKAWVTLKDQGELVNFIVAHVDLRGEALSQPRIIGMVKLKGGGKKVTPVYGEIKGVAPDQVKIGMKLSAVWAAEPQGEVSDLSHFQPVGK